MRLRKVLPEVSWRVLRDLYWHRFWKNEQADEARRLGFSSNQPIADSERAVLVERIADNYPFRTLLDVGCGYGSNFEAFAKLLPRSTFIGVDNDEKRVHEGNQLLGRRGIDNARLLVADARNLSIFPDNSIDLVIASGFFLYVSRDDVRRVAGEMVRVCGKAMLLVEQHDGSLEEEEALGKRVTDGAGRGYWVRNYQKVFSELVPLRNIKIFPIANRRWIGESWKDLGCLIEIRLSA